MITEESKIILVQEIGSQQDKEIANGIVTKKIYIRNLNVGTIEQYTHIDGNWYERRMFINGLGLRETTFKQCTTLVALKIEALLTEKT